ncbi:MAG: hypothetical protein JJ854_16525, partial [Pseudomonadales bacterium]|nr:hypothetical protein [Pseudomonadales bacterium]
IKSDLEIIPVKWIDEVLEVALQRMPEPLEEETDSEASSDAEQNSESGETPRISAH